MREGEARGVGVRVGWWMGEGSAVVGRERGVIDSFDVAI